MEIPLNISMKYLVLASAPALLAGGALLAEDPTTQPATEPATKPATQPSTSPATAPATQPMPPVFIAGFRG